VLIVDTGPLLAAADTADPYHRACVDCLTGATGPLRTTALVVAEAAYLIGRRIGPKAEARFFRSIADGDLALETLTEADIVRMADLVDQYADLPLGGTDASVVAIAERLDQATVATLDRRHFSVVRPRHVAGFELVPDLG
jgi:uncharacterized protein